MEIYIKEFKKKFNVKSSNKNMRATYDLQLTMAKAKDIAGKEPLEQIQATLDMTNKVMDYISNVLKLTSKQKDALDEMEANESIEIANYLAMRLMGVSESEIEDIKKNAKKDSDAEKKA